MGGIPKPTSTMFGGEFLEYAPDKSYAKNEAPGNVSWDGAELPFIPCRSVVAHMQPLDPALANFLKHIFKPGVLDKNLPQSNFLAQTRAPGKGAPQTLSTSGPVPFYDPKAGPMRPIKPGMPESLTKMTMAANPHLEGMARDWRGMLDLKREIAYTFRGDSRNPTALKTQFNGFQPSSSRTDDAFMHGPVYELFADYLQRAYAKKITLNEFKSALANGMSDPATQKLFAQYSVWRMVMKSEEMHLGRMLAHEVLKGYISSTKAVTVAKGFAMMKEGATEGWVYCVLLEGGYVVPGKDANNPWTKLFGEQEIAFPGAVPWDKVQGFRKVVAPSKTFAGPIFLRSSFTVRDEPAAEKVYKLLSGKLQKG